MEAPAKSDIIGPHRVFEKHMGETNCHPPVCSRHHIHTVGIWRQALESFIRFPALPQHPHAGWNGVYFGNNLYMHPLPHMENAIVNQCQQQKYLLQNQKPHHLPYYGLLRFCHCPRIVQYNNRHHTDILSGHYPGRTWRILCCIAMSVSRYGLLQIN